MIGYNYILFLYFPSLQMDQRAKQKVEGKAIIVLAPSRD